MSSKLKVGVIGLRMGGNHLKQYAEHASCDVVALCDTDEALLASRAEERGVAKTFTDYRRMLEDASLDLVSVATPNVLHRQMTVDALASGCHVLCEKPMAMNADEGRAMLDAATQHGRRLMIHFNRRFAPISQAAHGLINSGRLGEVYFVRSLWHRRSGVPWQWGDFSMERNGGGPLIDLGVHMLDLALWLAGYARPTCVMGGAWQHIAAREAERRGISYGVEDFGAAMIRLENGAMIELEASWAAHRAEKGDVHTRIHGSDGGLMFGSRGNQVFMELEGQPVNLSWDEAGLPPAVGACTAFADAIVRDEPTPVPAEQGLTVTQILDAIYQSARTGEPVAIDAT